MNVWINVNTKKMTPQKNENTRFFQDGRQMILTLPDHMINPKLSCDWCHQKRNKKTDVFPQTLAGEDDSRLKSRERSGWPRLKVFKIVGYRVHLNELFQWYVLSIGVLRMRQLCCRFALHVLYYLGSEKQLYWPNCADLCVCCSHMT